MPVISMSLPASLLRRLDAAAQRATIGRSAWLRSAIADRLAAPEPHGHVHGSITVAYAHGHEARISEVRHTFHDVVLSMMHTHCDPGQCMDVLLVGGDAGRILALQHQLETMRSVDRSVFVPVVSGR